jgi:hypothetical protein
MEEGKITVLVPVWCDCSAAIIVYKNAQRPVTPLLGVGGLITSALSGTSQCFTFSAMNHWENKKADSLVLFARPIHHTCGVP